MMNDANEELLENLLFSATFPAMDKWRNMEGPEPPLDLMRVHVRMELRLQHRYGAEYDQLIEKMRWRQWTRAAVPMIAFGAGVFLLSGLIRPRAQA